MKLVEVEVEAESGIARITLNRPEVLNAIDLNLARAFRDCVLPLTEMSGLRCVVLKGSGRAFMAGGDVSGFAESFDRAGQVIGDLLAALNPAIEALRNLDAPILAAVHGAAAGAGLALVSACDIVVAAESTKFLMAYDRIGGVPDCGATYFLPRVLGVRKAAQLMMLSETMTAVEAKEAGLVNFVVPDDGLSAEVERLAKKIATGPTRSYGQYKRLVQAGFDNSLHDQLEAERAAFVSATATQDFRSGVTAFLTKKKPDFTGN